MSPLSACENDSLPCVLVLIPTRRCFVVGLRLTLTAEDSMLVVAYN